MLIIGTANPGKVEEFLIGLRDFSVPIKTLMEMKIKDPEETGTTYEFNASLKASYYSKIFKEVCLADDSGIEVDALGGAPGVYSARFSNYDGTQKKKDVLNVKKLLDLMSSIPIQNRTARQVCCISIHDQDSKEMCTVTRICTGKIAMRPRGSNGFGYDNVFIPDGSTKTFAQMEVKEKLSWSHRGKALEDAKKWLDLNKFIFGGRVLGEERDEIRTPSSAESNTDGQGD